MSMQRRRLLALLGAGAATSAAGGCAGLGQPGGDDLTNGDDGGPTADDDRPLTGPGTDEAADTPGLALDADVEPTLLWFDIGPDGRRYLLTETAIHSVAGDGSGRWTYEHEGGVEGLVPGPELVYVGIEVVRGMVGGPTGVAALRPADGTVEWTTTFDPQMRVRLLDAGAGRVYGGSIDDTGGAGHERFALARADGAIEWLRDDHMASRGLVAGERLYVVYGSKGVSAYDVTDGTRLWEGESEGWELATAGERILCGPSPLLACDRGGTTVWTFDEGDIATSPESHPHEWAVAPDEATVYVTGDEGSISAVDVPSGSVRWQFRATDGAALSTLLTADGGVYGVAGQEVVAVDAAGPPVRWRVDAVGAHALRRTDTTVFAISRAGEESTGRLTAVDPASGSIRWTRRAPISWAAAAPDRSSISVALRDGRLYTVTAALPLPNED